MAIVAAVSCEPAITALEIKRELELPVSVSTIKRRLYAAGLKSRVACQRPRLNESEKRARLEFATEHLSWQQEDWREVVFSDESTFVTKWDQQRRVWRLLGTR